MITNLIIGMDYYHCSFVDSLYFSQNILRMIKSKRMGWAWHVESMGVMKNPQKVLSENLKGRDHLEDRGIDGRIILKWILQKSGVRVWGHRLEYWSSQRCFLSCNRHVVILNHTKNHYTKVLYFPKVFSHTSQHVLIASGASVDPTSQVCSSAMLVSPIVENWQVRF
jgi:hypothetical protein